MIRSLVAFVGLPVGLVLAGAAAAAECPGHPDALGVERVITVDPTEHRRIGTMQYPESLPLHDHEVVLTFDDGPLPPYTARVLQTLAAECVKATFFMVGRQARAFPDWVRRVYNAGHTVASHSQNHPLIFTRLKPPAADAEIEGGIASVTAALGEDRALAPFFRFPGLGRSQAIEAYLASRGIMVWSADFPADDWKHISGSQVMARALERLERKGKGVLLLHDIQPATALMLPQLLRELKNRGYRIVHVVPAGPERPKTVTEPQSWVMRKAAPGAWPRIVEAPEGPAPSAESFGWPHPFRVQKAASMPPVSPAAQGAPAAAPAAADWAPAPYVAPVRTVELSALSPTPTGTFTDPPADAAALAALALTDGEVVSPAEVFAEMSGPTDWAPPARAKPRAPARTKLRPGAKPATATRAAAVRPPLPLIDPPARLVAHAPPQTAR